MGSQQVIDLTNAVEATTAAAIPTARFAQPARSRSAAAAGVSRTQRHRWNFVINNCTPEHSFYSTVGELVGDGAPLVYICVAPEDAPTTGTKHVQGFLYINKEVYPSGMREGQVADMLKPYCSPHYAHVNAVAEGDNHFCINYCKGLVPKKGMTLNLGFREWGNPQEIPGVKEATADASYEVTLRAAKSGRFCEIPAQHQLKFYSSIKSIYADAHMDRTVSDLPKPNTFWIWGRAGSGKTTYAYKMLQEKYPGKEIYPKDPSEKWWPSYPPGGDAEQLPVVMDDVGPYHIKNAGLWKVWCGDRAFISEMKHSSGKMRPPCIVVTSQYHPSSIFRDRETLEAMMRRCQVFEYRRHSGPNAAYGFVMEYEEFTGTGDQEWALANPCSNDGATGTLATFNLPDVLYVPEGQTLPQAVRANVHANSQVVIKQDHLKLPLRRSVTGAIYAGTSPVTPVFPKRVQVQPDAPTKDPNVVVERVILNLETGQETPMNEEPVLVNRVEETGTQEI